jgi:hypothetical protein
MNRIFALCTTVVAQAVLTSAAIACPVCVSETGAQIRAMLATDPLWHFAAIVAPIPILFAAVAVVRLATPWLLRAKRDTRAVRRELV